MNRITRRIACAAFAAFAAAFLWSCGGGKPSMASRSAAAYADAQKKGIHVTGGEHGGHAVTEPAAHTNMESMDHATMTGEDHSTMAGMDHATMAGMQHENASTGHAGTKQMSGSMPGMEHQGVTGPEHAQMRGMKMQHGGTPGGGHSMAGMGSMPMPGMQHGSMHGMQHGSMPGMQHGEMPAMQHGGTPMQGMPGMEHGAMPGMSGMQHGAAAHVVVDTAVPATSGAMVDAQPAATLRGDDFDAPAPISRSEAAKAAGTPTTHTKDH